MENFAFLPHRAEAHTTVLSKPVGQRLRAYPDADCILPEVTARKNGTKVWNVVNRRLCETTGAKNFFGRNVTPGSPLLTTPHSVLGFNLHNFS
jgi:hypothetical protein